MQRLVERVYTALDVLIEHSIHTFRRREVENQQPSKGNGTPSTLL